MDLTPLAALTVPDTAVVPRRRMGLMELLVEHISQRDRLPVVEVSDIAPVRSMFDYDPADAVAITELPPGLGQGGASGPTGRP